MPSRKTRSSHLCTSPRRDGPIFVTGCDVIFSSMIQTHKKSPRALESSAPPWPGPRLLLSKSRVCSKLTSIWLKSRVWYRVSSKSSVPSFEYRVLTKSSATSCGSHRVLPRLEYRVLSTESSAPSIETSCTNQVVYRVHVFSS